MGSDESNSDQITASKPTNEAIHFNCSSSIATTSNSHQEETVDQQHQDSDLRCEEQLKIKIGEAKRLPGPGKGGTGSRDVYVTINLDREEIFRTSVIEKTLNPFFGEEFAFEIPRRFRSLSLYVYDKELNRNLMLIKNKKEKQLTNTVSYISNTGSNSGNGSRSRDVIGDKVIGKVCIRREDLFQYHGKDHWFKLVPVTEDSEVSGQIQFTIKLIDQVVNSSTTIQKLTVRVIECDDLTLINGSCDPFVVVTMNCLTTSKDGSIKLKKVQTKRTKIKKRTNSPLFDEIFYLNIPNCSSIGTKGKVKSSISASSSSSGEHESGTGDLGTTSTKTQQCSQVPEESVDFSPERTVDVALGNIVITLSVFHDGPSSLIGSASTFLGQVNVPLASILDQVTGRSEDDITLPPKGYSNWHLLQPRTNSLVPQSPNNDALSPTADKPKTHASTQDPKSKSDDDLGSLRLKINYTSDYVLSSRYYESLKWLVLKSPSIKPITSSTAFILGEILSNNKAEVAASLVKLFISSSSGTVSNPNQSTSTSNILSIMNHPHPSTTTDHGHLLSFIRSFGEWEISRVTDPNTIFRGNTLLSKFLDELMRFTGSKYLHETLKDVIHVIIAEKKCCEIDGNRLKDPKEMDDNMSNLIHYLNAIFKSIITSVILCPKVMRESFSILKELALKYFPGDREVMYSVISGFIFLRFFAPAILNPKLFDIITDSSITIDPVCMRTLTLISKTIQMMGNLVSCRMAGTLNSPIRVQDGGDANHPVMTRRYSQSACFKEDFMAELQSSFVTDEYIESTRMFLEMVSSPTNVTITSHLTDRSIVLKDGYLMKKTSGPTSVNVNIFKSLFSSRNKFRKRFFVLSTHTLSYSRRKSRNSRIKWSIPIQDLISVQKAPEESFITKRVLEITYQPDQVLYLKTGNCVDEQDWFSVLRRICGSNAGNRPRLYHPATFVGNQWTCCKSSDESAVGCCSVSNHDAIHDLMSVTIDADREVARIQSLLVSKRNVMNELHENCVNLIKDLERNFGKGDGSSIKNGEEITVSCGETADQVKVRESVYDSCLIEDPESFMSTLEELELVVDQLQRDEEMFVKKEVVDTVYGSKTTPIGDDRYLSLMKRHTLNNHS